jgi:uncharacterized HAD superfamily protein
MPRDKWLMANSEKLCAFDIDGCLNYYPDPWVDFLNDKLGTWYTDLNEAKASISYQEYKDIKYQYRESGVKRTLPVREGARKTLQQLKKNGYTILILTSRPFDKHKSLFKQTTDWLYANKLPYDGIIFGENKYLEVLTKAPTLRFMVEDHRYYANLIAKWGYRVYLVDNKYNQGDILPNVTRIKEIGDVLDYEFHIYNQTETGNL